MRTFAECHSAFMEAITVLKRYFTGLAGIFQFISHCEHLIAGQLVGSVPDRLDVFGYVGEIINGDYCRSQAGAFHALMGFEAAVGFLSGILRQLTQALFLSEAPICRSTRVIQCNQRLQGEASNI